MRIRVEEALVDLIKKVKLIYIQHESTYLQQYFHVAYWR